MKVEQTAGTEVAQVCIPNSMRDYYDYIAAPSECAVGARVRVPFQNRYRIGVVMGFGTSMLPPKKLRAVDACLDTQAILSAMDIELLQWVASYYQSPLSEVLALALPKKVREGRPLVLQQHHHYCLRMPLESARQRINVHARAQAKLLDCFTKEGECLPEKVLPGSKSVRTALVDKGILQKTSDTLLPFAINTQPQAPLPLHSEQKNAFATISEDLSAFHSFLLEGVTGSGKTEVYLQIIAAVLAHQRQAMVLVPEIGLTPQLVERFRQRFDVPIVVMHSHLNDTERFQAWQLAEKGIARLLIGTRSAVFAPMPELGVIVIDEEHDASLKQMDGVRYSARDTALMRAKQREIPIVLGTATPSLESLYNATCGKHRVLKLREKALDSAPLHYELVDIRSQRLQEGLAAKTVQKIAAHLQEGQQVLVFINRRGFAPVMLCHDCGAMIDCRDCDAHMTFHRKTQRLCCHHCGLSMAMPARCPKCQGAELIAVGVGTQRLEAALRERFPDVSVARIDRDEVRGKEAFEAQLDAIHAGKVQLIIGTQMMAKGHHFPNLTLAVILDCDAGLSHSDFRATERLGQLLLQVAGRAGRAERAGEVLIQTHQPDHPLLNQLIKKGYGPFSEALLALRQQAQLPPCSYMALIRARSHDFTRVQAFMRHVQQYLQAYPLVVLGPVPAPMARKAGEHQFHLLLKSTRRRVLQQALHALRQVLQVDAQAKRLFWSVDVDPLEIA